ncbi:SsrA-binding protein [Humidesulfovibrio mexicanus]|uniref:SsrA-binding protein n=1 Tax=Humidesulfovibrio mexicanus TaxID=147047 RepID=A0A239ALN3_9BACT|nr:SsrA-binding protein SmpB [Humidesulfovibrio mexicanus]SNR96469.1 SsrA-binding protein [Humidesulfovibrio mexicanus]
MSNPNRHAGEKLIASNRNARRLYEFLDTYEAGLVLMGSELKSLREGRVNFMDGYVRFQNHEAWLTGVHIAPYANAGMDPHDPTRERKLLLHHREIDKLQASAAQKGLTVVPVRLYFKNGRVKLEIALGRGKNVHDRRDDLKERDLQRDTQRQLADWKH